jgi:hypothetical protein
MKEQNEDSNEDGIPDMTGVKAAPKNVLDPLEREEREAAKKNTPDAPKGAYVCLANIKSDDKTFKKGEEYVGKLYADLLSAKVICKKEDWVSR